jgi:hypothetical protein
MTRKRSFLFQAIEAEHAAGARLHIRRLDQQLEHRHAAANMENLFPKPELRIGAVQNRIDAARHAAGLPIETRVANVGWESPNEMLAKAIRSGVANLAEEVATHEANEQFSVEYRTIFGRAPDGLSRSDLAEQEQRLTATAAALEHVSTLLEE